ncbi:MAG: glycosyltransferase family 4 protein [Candidatus Brocadiaceae bacterium]|nr:glycosyltransferase family 4 protein [Candidatus Brocadiaceae bacterium]
MAEKIQIDSFIYMSMKSDQSKTSSLKYAFFCVYSALILLKRKTKIDLVITYDPLKTGLIGLFVSRMLKAKFAPEVNGVYTSQEVYMDDNGKLLKSFKGFAYPMIMRFVLKRADGIKLQFKNQIDPFKKILLGKIIKSFPDYIAVDDFKNIKEEKEVLLVGFPFRLKGVDILINAFKKIAIKYPEWKLKILGWYPDPKELNEAISGHPQIYHHKPICREEMPSHIGSCGIFVLPSRSDALPRVLREAMAAGKPRIGSNVDGIPTLINDGVDGLLVEPENIDDLAKKLDMLMGNPEMRQKLGNNGEKRARKEFAEEVYFRNIVSFYNSIFTGVIE